MNWKVLIIGVVVVALAVGALAFYKSRQDATDQQVQQQQQQGQGQPWNDPYKNLQVPAQK